LKLGLFQTFSLFSVSLVRSLGGEEFPLAVQLNSVRTTTLIRRDDNNIQRTPFDFLDSVLAFFLWVKWCSSLQILAYSEIAVYRWLKNFPEQNHSALSLFACPDK